MVAMLLARTLEGERDRLGVREKERDLVLERESVETYVRFIIMYAECILNILRVCIMRFFGIYLPVLYNHSICSFINITIAPS